MSDVAVTLDCLKSLVDVGKALVCELCLRFEILEAWRVRYNITRYKLLQCPVDDHGPKQCDCDG